MTPQTGFFIERVTALGATTAPAQVDFIDGLNVVEGPSNTGKSYLCSLIDFAFGAGTAPRKINASKGYDRVVVRLRERGTNTLHEIERSFRGGGVLIRQLAADEGVISERTAGAKHVAGNDTTLSSFLLRLAGFADVAIRQNKEGKTRSLSFRDIAFLTIVEEARIISEGPPHLSEIHQENTAEAEVLRLLVTGAPPPTPVPLPKKNVLQSAKAQLALVETLLAEVNGELTKIDVIPDNVSAQLSSIEQAWLDTLRAHDTLRTELATFERERATSARKLRETHARLDVIETLTARFKLLEGHYDSDVLRLDAIHEAGTMLEELPPQDCPVCGAPGSAHRTSESAAHFQLSTVRSAATAEREKVEKLRQDLKRTLEQLTAEAAALVGTRDGLQQEVDALQAKISGEAEKRLKPVALQLQQLSSRRDVLMRARFMVDRLLELRARELALKSISSTDTSSAASTKPRTAEMEPLSQRVEEVLRRWSFPELDRVVFADETQDFVIAGEDRKSNGKGVRAVTFSATILALMRHCALQHFAHPGFVVLDSPLVAYKAPDEAAEPDPDLVKLLTAGVKEAFYSSLADGLALGQVIVLENTPPPAKMAGLFKHIHFTKSTDFGRYGLFPVTKAA